MILIFWQIQTVVDLIYNPECKFLSLAKQSGCQTMNGLEMPFQGIKAYELWLECQVPSSLQEQVIKWNNILRQG